MRFHRSEVRINSNAAQRSVQPIPSKERRGHGGGSLRVFSRLRSLKWVPAKWRGLVPAAITTLIRVPRKGANATGNNGKPLGYLCLGPLSAIDVSYVEVHDEQVLVYEHVAGFILPWIDCDFE
jgi:hypothetical protein